MEIYRVKQEDLIGDIKDFPIEVVQKMVERQYEQTGRCDVTVFQEKPDSGVSFRGFNWDNTKEDEEFWFDIIINKDFDVFFARYPKQEVQVQQEEDYWIKPEGVKMLVWDKYEDEAEERTVIAKLPKNSYYTYLCVNNWNDEEFKKGEKYATEMYKNAKPIPQIKEITMQEIADKFGLKVDEFKIV